MSDFVNNVFQFSKNHTELNDKEMAIKELDLIDNDDDIEERAKKLLARRWKYINSRGQ